jgi:hypothetical protein
MRNSICFLSARFAFALLAVAPAALGAQVPAAVAPAPPTLLAGTNVDFVITDHLGSKLSHIGDTFHVRVAEPVRVNDVIVIPAGTEGGGEVIHAARARAGGKAGELILSVHYLTLADRRIALRGFHFGRSGTDNSGTGLLVAAVAGSLGFLVVGGEVDVPAGTVGHARIATDTSLASTEHAQP